MSDPIRLSRLDARRLGDFERLFSGREFDGCFCSYWTGHDAGWEERCKTKSPENLEHMRRLVRAGGHAGFLAHRESDGAVVGWAAAGPKTAYPKLKDEPGARLGRWEDSAWAVACLSVAFPYRGLGFSRAMLRLVIEEARRAGARTLEGYPSDSDSEEEAYRGSKALYQELGFAAAGSEAGVTRMEKAL